MITMVSVTLFGGPADGRTLSAPDDADFVDYHVKVGKPLFSDGTISTTTHRYWIERSTSRTHGIGLHAGPVSHRKDSPEPATEG